MIWPERTACQRCLCVWYCSPDCQREHWATEHKQACTMAAAERDAARPPGGSTNNKKNKKGKGKK